MFHVPNKYRNRTHPILKSTDEFGNNGFFHIPLKDGATANVQASEGLGWEHVSVHVVEDDQMFTPTWDEMCAIKDIFWDEEDCVVQYHPPKSMYVNHHEHVLHLWKPQIKQLPVPNPELIGIKMKK